MRKWKTIAGVVLLLFGLACFNYTKASAWGHHMAFAAQHGFPQPSNTILLVGILAATLGAGMIGYSLGVRKRES